MPPPPQTQPSSSSTTAPNAPAPAFLPLSQGPRLIVYHQTHHKPNGEPISILPVITNNTGITHVIVAALHLNDGPGNITLNDNHPSHKKFDQLWGEVRWLQGAGVKVLLMLGGAAQGSYRNLCRDDASVRTAHQFRVNGMKSISNSILYSSKPTTAPSSPSSAPTPSTASTSTSKSPSPIPPSADSSSAYTTTSAPRSSSPSPPSPPR